MGHARPETTAGHVHLSPEMLATEHHQSAGTMTGVLDTHATVQPAGDVLADYQAFVDQPPCAGQGRRLRKRAAQRFLARWPDLQAWMASPRRPHGFGRRPPTASQLVGPTRRHGGASSVRAAYDAAIANTRTKQQLLVAGRGGTFVPEDVEGLHSEMI